MASGSDFHLKRRKLAHVNPACSWWLVSLGGRLIHCICVWWCSTDYGDLLVFSDSHFLCSKGQFSLKSNMSVPLLNCSALYPSWLFCHELIQFLSPFFWLYSADGSVPPPNAWQRDREDIKCFPLGSDVMLAFCMLAQLPDMKLPASKIRQGPQAACHETNTTNLPYLI